MVLDQKNCGAIDLTHMILQLVICHNYLLLMIYSLTPCFSVAIRAIELKNHSTLNGKVIRVMWSRRDPDGRRSGVGNVFVKVTLKFYFI